MSFAYDLFQNGDSWLYRLDPRVKLLASICGSALLLSCRNFWLVLVALLLILAILLSAGISRATLGSTLRILVPVMVMIVLFTALFTPVEGTRLFQFWIVTCTTGSLLLGITLGLRIAALAYVILAWLYTTDQSALTRSLVALGLPHPWGLTLAIALRHIPLLAATFRQISDAQQARALELSRGSLLHKARAFIPITVAMIINSLRTAEALSRALVSRGFGAPIQRTIWRPLKMRAADWVWLAMILVSTVVGLIARYAFGFGIDNWFLFS
ncbi:MAG: energy-coupling factor transporter transmembrane protein EcfT [Chloroflexi bacterium]|nr:energy-coupling factor transporter transmembrane protein EcfT [Chloroflexota bacterium]